MALKVPRPLVRLLARVRIVTGRDVPVPDGIDGLRLLAQLGYWEDRRQALARRFRLGQTRVLGRELRDRARDSTRIVRGLILHAALSLALTIVGLGAIQVIAVGLGHLIHWGSLFKAISLDNYAGFVAAAVGIEATFLALFFTTVGVVAATAYADVPTEVRSLFVEERASTVYVWNIVVALLVGVVLLVEPLLFKAEPRGLALLVFAVLSALSVLSLVFLGTRLFTFFDLSELARPLPARFLRAVRYAAAGERAPVLAQQERAHDHGREVLVVFGQLADLFKSRDVRHAAAPHRVAALLLACWRSSAAGKAAIPTKSHWFALVPQHPNWLTLDNTRLSTAMATRSGVHPSLVPDPIWVERSLANSLSAILGVMADEPEAERIISVADEANSLIWTLSYALQLEEARLLRDAVGGVLDRVAIRASLPSVDTHGERPDDFLSLAARERRVLGYTQQWLGLAQRCDAISHDLLAASFDDAVSAPNGPYRVFAFRELLAFFEDAAHGIRFEVEAEGRRITPRWWVHHLSARHLLKQIGDSATLILEDVRTTLIAPIVADDDEVPEATVTRVLGCLELIEKVHSLLPTIIEKLAIVSSFRNEATNDPYWPSSDIAELNLRDSEGLLYVALGRAALRLGNMPHDDARPDFLGRAYRTLADATYQSIVSGDNDLAGTLFPIIMTLADRASDRIFTDLASAADQQRSIYGTEPPMDLMELSGYALFMTELDGSGIWADVRARWEARLAEETGPALVEYLVRVATFQANTFSLTAGSIGRTNRRMALARLLASRGIRQVEPLWGMHEDPPHPNPVVAEFAPSDMGLDHDLSDLFLAEFLFTVPAASGLTMPSRTAMLRRALSDRRGVDDIEDDEL